MRLYYKVIIKLLLSLLLSSCAHFDRNEPTVKPKLYAGSYIENAIVRKQSNEVIQCTDRKFNDFVCLSYTDLLNIQYLLDSCQK